MPLISSIRQFLMRRVMVKLNRFTYVTLYGMDIGEGVRISRGARLDKTNPKGIHIGAYSAVTKGAIVLSHDFVNREWKDTRIGKNCFLGYNCIIMPGITIGDNCIVAANSLVGRDVQPNCVVMGNPAKVVEQGIVTGEWGIRLDKGNSSPIEK
jgi:acetyltransferase-like isoleucine patch superfamily enzyme